jgi:hypothetical protein
MNIITKLLGISIFAFGSATAVGQTKTSVKVSKPKPPIDRYASLAVQATSPLFIAASVHQDWWLGKKQKFVIGGGLRLTSSFGSNAQFITAPAKLTSGKQGPSVFFAPQINANIDSFGIAKVQSNAINITGNIGYRFTKKLSAGFNIDVVGISFGAAQSAMPKDQAYI